MSFASSRRRLLWSALSAASWWQHRWGDQCQAMSGKVAYGDSVSYCVLAHRPRVFWPRPARLMAAGGHRHCAVVAIGFRRRLANQREADAALHHSGAGTLTGTWDRSAYAMEARDPASVAVVRTAGAPQRKDSRYAPVRDAALLSQDRAVRSAARVRCQNGFFRGSPSLRDHDLTPAVSHWQRFKHYRTRGR